VLAAKFVAEFGDIGRFALLGRLASWAGPTPKHHESDTTIHRDRITKMGSRLVRWAAVEAARRTSTHSDLGALAGSRRGSPRPQHQRRPAGRRRPAADRGAHPGVPGAVHDDGGRTGRWRSRA